MTAKTAFVFLAAFSSTGALVGCSGSGSNQPADPDPSTVRASLHRSKGCTDLLGDFKADAKYKVNRGINRQIDSINKCIAAVGDANCAYGGYGGYGGGYGGALPPTDAAESGSSSSGGAPTPNAPTGSASSGDKAASHSDTNTQVKGVDEADIVKTDGTSLFVLHGNALKVVKAWPVADLKEATSTPIEGYPSEMFVNAGKAVIYSTVNGYSIYGQAGVQPKDTYYDWGYGYYATGGDAVAQPYYPGTGYSSGPYVPLTKVTVLDLTGAAPAVTREMYFEGGYLDARRVDNHVRTVFTGAAHGPKLLYSVYDLYPQGESTPSYDPGTGSSSSSTGGSTSGSPTNPYPQTGTAMIGALEQMRAKNLASIDASQLNDWLPYTFVKNGASMQAKTVACEDFYMPSLGSSDAGLTEVVSFDLANPASLPKETAIAAAADTVYGSADTLYLASRAWIEPPFAWQYYGGGPVNAGTTASPPPSAGGSSGSSGDAPPVDPPAPGTKSLPVRTSPTQVIAWSNEKTHLHKFEFQTDATFPNYLASGTVIGAIKDQFSMDEKDNNLRISTTESRSYFDVSGQYVSSDSTGAFPYNVNHLFVLGQNGTWLDKVGDAGDLAPNERIYSTRFIGNRGYVTTFRQVDPLFVFDLSNPANPQKLAELTIPGFSEYMHPLDATHLLTIGRDASSTGQANGLQLRIFDVADGAHPKVAQQYTYSNLSYGSSDAEYDHKAFTYFEEKKLLAFPFYSYSNNGTSGSSLEVFSVDAATGFAKVGSVDSSTLISKAPQGYCGGYYGPSVRRGVFLENWVYSVSYAGIVAKDSANMGAAGYSIPLGDPQTNDGYGPVCAYGTD